MTRFDWDDLKYFLAVARAQTVSQASRALGVDHATVVRRLDHLEQAFGSKLFQRNARGYDLTQNGERLLVSAKAIETETFRAFGEIGGGNPSISGTVRISTLEGFGNFFLAERIPRFAVLHPGLSVELITIQQIVALSRRDPDIAVTLQPPTQGRFTSIRLTDYNLFVYGARDYLKKAPGISKREDLRRHPFTGYIDDLVFMRDLDYLNEIGYDQRPLFQSSSLHAQMEAVLAGYGLCVLPAFMASRHPDLVAVLPEDVFLSRSYWLVCHADAVDAPRVRALCRYIQQIAAESATLFLGTK